MKPRVQASHTPNKNLLSRNKFAFKLGENAKTTRLLTKGCVFYMLSKIIKKNQMFYSLLNLALFVSTLKLVQGTVLLKKKRLFYPKL